MEFHISRKARDLYHFDESLFLLHGNVILANFHSARVFAQKINSRQDLARFPEKAVRAGQINAMGLIDEILHLVVNIYRQQKNPMVMQDALDWLYGLLGKEAVYATLRMFVEEFPPVAIYNRTLSIDEYIEGDTLQPGGQTIPNRLAILEEMLMLWLANANPAFTPYLELFDDTHLAKETYYNQVVSTLHAFFETQPLFGPDNQNLIDMLHSPAIAVPHSLPGQLEYIRQCWSFLLGKYLYRILGSLDLIQEEDKAIFQGPGPSRVTEFRGLELEPELFSPDKDWMPRLVLIAKNAYVWLDQLSKKYSRSISTLDQIPDDELDTLARWGFTGLWLIGLWERSAASRRIKQLRGNPEAVASAYSLFDYQIAGDLGGNEAFQNLRERAWRRGIRLASDMVPNHMGIDSRWVIEHPEWFLSLDYSPFPSYSFNSTNLSWDDRVELAIEDHYYNNTDAAVVFKRHNRWSGDTKYIYHGNDGTSMPWNDTAQLNYLKPEVREAVIQTILSVARNFPVIRFDAAMTLAKKHYQRLWFPEPGTGGAIPSRADHGMTKDQFDSLIPIEFWREVVDRVAQEVPDTLLLAEAFWLMEGYFVRSLGMHRVYNSAFMNMLRDEKNAEYRLVIKNTLEFDPEILKRYVNFMNNPDERTAVDQFGKGDKYFGICTMMATMPGLPMFGHGQVEGFTEKYGMEYRRAYWEETPDGYLVQRHERDMFPLLRKRYLFAEVSNFLLYDFYTPEGYVNEDVFAYSNQAGDERSLVVYHNKYATTRGWIHNSVAYAIKGASGKRTLAQKSLGEGLALQNDPRAYTIFRDHISDLEFIRNNQELHEKGLYVELEAYKSRIFLDFYQVQDNQWHQYAQLTAYLNGGGVPSIDEAMKEIFLQPIHQTYHELVNADWFHWIIENRWNPQKVQTSIVLKILDEGETKALHLLYEIKRITQGNGDEIAIAHGIRQELEVVMSLPLLDNRYPISRSRKYKEAIQYLKSRIDSHPLVWGTLLSWLFTHKLGKTILIDREDEADEASRSWIDEWLLGKIIAGTLRDLGIEDGASWRAVSLVKLLTTHSTWYQNSINNSDDAALILQGWFKDGQLQAYLGVNRYQDTLWFNQESFEDLLWWAFAVAVVKIVSYPDSATKESTRMIVKRILGCYHLINQLQNAALKSGFQVEKLLELAREQ